jgi:hypothetical protein
MDNPLVKQKEPPKQKYPITVKFIVDNLSDRFPDVLKIREYAHSQNINFMTREYNSTKYSDDRHLITSLPAFHIYVNNNCKNTFYLNTRPYQIIQETVEKYEAALEKRRLKRSWTTFYTDIKVYIKQLFHRKTALEKMDDEKEFQRKRMSIIKEWL